MEASPKRAGSEAPAGRRTLGRRTFELVHVLISSGKKPTEAFALVASDSGHSAVTVATAYSPVARTIPGGAGVQQRLRQGGRSTSAAASTTQRSGTTTSELLRQLVDAAAALGRHAERPDREHAEYRQIAAAFERLR